jgi:GPH family glycoside/pentoside/hexuronide:cation symporter
MVDIAVVGNEVLLRGELPEAELLACIARVKAAVPADVQVGCVDAYFQFLERPALTAACDVLLPNCYPFWEGADIDLAAQYLRRMHGLVKAAGGDKPVIVTETGWPGRPCRGPRRCPRPRTRCATSSTCSNGPARRRQAVLLLVVRRALEAGQEGEVGTQWGLWDKDERPKYRR